MDQNGNNVNGENPGDVYSNTVSITPAARPTEGVPFADAFAGAFGDSLGRQWLETNGYFLIQTKPDGAPNVAVAQFMGENRAILLVHHLGKNDRGEGAASRGSGALPGFVDVIVEMRRFEADDRNDRKRVLAGWSSTDTSMFRR